MKELGTVMVVAPFLMENYPYYPPFIQSPIHMINYVDVSSSYSPNSIGRARGYMINHIYVVCFFVD